MDKDFHFYVVGMLAKHAGFEDDQAITIATASQYTDHATESFPINLSSGRIVETTMTAHYHIKAFNEGVQKKTFMCFHFPPEGLATEDNRFDFRVKKNSTVMIHLLQSILDAKNKNDPRDDLKSSDKMPFYLYRLGVALHTFADSWAHQTFSGRENKENDVGTVWFGKNKDWERQYLDDWKWDFAPRIGHAQCGHNPDQPFKEFRYEMPKQGNGKFEQVERYNPNEFTEASKEILDWLRKFNGTENENETAWREDAPAMQAINLLLSTRKSNANDRITSLKSSEVFKSHFNVLFNEPRDYVKNRWRDAVMTPTGRDDKWGEREKRSVLHVKENSDFNSSSFRLFHKAAKRQRTFILDWLFW